MKQLSLKSIREQLSSRFVTVSKLGDEYRVQVKGSPAGEGYYTTDSRDALATARHMHERKLAGISESAVLGGVI